MGRRFSNIRRAAQLQAALTAYTTWLTEPRQPRINSRGARPPSKAIYVTPFGFDLETDELARARNSVEGYTALASTINASGTGGKVVDTLGTNSIATVGRFSPARIVWFRNASRSVQEVRSEITNQDYLKYNGDRSSCAFGREQADDNMYDAFDAIKAALTAANSSLEVNRISLTREKYSYN